MEVLKNKCLKCGSENFCTNLSSTAKAKVIDGLLLVENKDHTELVDNIYCDKCGEEYSHSNFKRIEFEI